MVDCAAAKHLGLPLIIISWAGKAISIPVTSLFRVMIGVNFTNEINARIEI